jgi:hypothetical protein
MYITNAAGEVYRNTGVKKMYNYAANKKQIHEAIKPLDKRVIFSHPPNVACKDIYLPYKCTSLAQ